jgi:Cd2+/Zn2+-exporting ATPase
MIVKIEGLDCPNCARALEGEINKLSSVKNAKIEFVKSKLIFESNECTDEHALEEIIKLTKKIEPDVKIIAKSGKKDKNVNIKFIFDLILLIFGIAIGFIIFFVQMPTWTFWTLYVLAVLMLGYKTYYKAVTQIFRGVVNENLLLTISVVGASIVGEHMEGLMVIALYSIGKIFESLAVNRSRKSIESLVKMQPEFAVIVTEKGEERVEPRDVEVGSTIIVRAGEKVALDGEVISGEISVDMQSLTGESVPVLLKEGDEILSGAIVLDGVVKIKTTKMYDESTIKKIMNLIENASQNKSKTETFISKITKWYTLGIVALAVIVWGIVWAVTKNIDVAVYRGLIFLVISCPCAFAISVPLTYFSGLGSASKRGILIKGSNYLDACAKLDTMVFDKTGTLTTGQFSIEHIESELAEEEIIFLASVGEQYSIHPLAKAIVSACVKTLPKIEDFKEIAGEGIEFNFQDKNYFVGRKDKTLKSTVVEVYCEKDLLGRIYLSDTVKSSSKDACSELKNLGLKTVMLSGDNEESVRKVCEELDIDEGYAKLLPQEKYAFIERLKVEKKRIGYVGDGINDAPSLVLSDVGISMGVNGAPASVEASDIVLVDDDPKKIALAIKISKKTRKIVLQNIIFSAVIKVAFLSLGALGVTGMISAVFADVGVTLLAILNSMRALKEPARK